MTYSRVKRLMIQKNPLVVNNYCHSVLFADRCPRLLDRLCRCRLQLDRLCRCCLELWWNCLMVYHGLMEYKLVGYIMRTSKRVVLCREAFSLVYIVGFRWKNSKLVDKYTCLTSFGNREMKYRLKLLLLTQFSSISRRSRWICSKPVAFKLILNLFLQDILYLFTCYT